MEFSTQTRPRKVMSKHFEEALAHVVQPFLLKDARPYKDAISFEWYVVVRRAIFPQKMQQLKVLDQDDLKSTDT